MDNERLQILLKENHPFHIYSYAKAGSTNTEAERKARSGCPDWSVVVAGEQTAGKGRYRRRWESPAGQGLWFSVVLRPAVAPERINLLNLLTALIVSNFLEEKIAQSSTGKMPAVNLKWPNDILIDGRKIAGILLQSKITSQTVEYLIVGIGININQKQEDFPPELRNTATSLRMVTGKSWNLEELLAQFLVNYYRDVNRAIASDFEGIVPIYERKLIHRGKHVQVKLPAHVIEGEMLGIDEKGYLLLETAEGKRQITAGDLWEIKNGVMK